MAGDEHLIAGEIGLLTIATIVLWGWLTPKSWRIVPAPLVGVLVGMAAAAVLKLDQIHYIDVPNNIWSVTILPTTEKLMRIVEPSILIGAISIAFIASAETLLCATAVDQMHRGPRTQYDKELVAQGVGNTICGLLGVLPMTGVIVRSSANVQAGAVTRASAIMHGAVAADLRQHDSLHASLRSGVHPGRGVWSIPATSWLTPRSFRPC